MLQRVIGLRFIAWFIVMVLVGTVGFAGITEAQDDVVARNKAVVQRLVDDIYNAGDYVVFDEAFSPDYLSHEPAGNLSTDEVKNAINGLRAAMPDLQAAVEVMIGEGDWVATREAFRGTFTNALVTSSGTWQPNQETIEWHENNFYHFSADGQVVEAFIGRDELNFRRQVGGLPLVDILARVTSGGASDEEALLPTMGETVVPRMEDAHREGFRQVIEESLNQGNVDLMDQYMDEGYIGTDPFGPVSREQFKDVVTGLRTAVPDLHVEIDVLIAEGDWVAARLIYGGTFTNPIAANVTTVEPTGRPFEFGLNVVEHFNERGLADADWKEFNALGWLQQLGVLPSPLG